MLPTIWGTDKAPEILLRAFKDLNIGEVVGALPAVCKHFRHCWKIWLVLELFEPFHFVCEPALIIHRLELTEVCLESLGQDHPSPQNVIVIPHEFFLMFGQLFWLKYVRE